MHLDRLKSIRIHGLNKLFHVLFLGLTFPLRHPFKFLSLLFVCLVLLASIPMMQGVSYRHIIDWYLLRNDKIEANQVSKPQVLSENKPVAEEKSVFKEVAAPKIIRKENAIEDNMLNGEKVNVETNTEKSPVKRRAFKKIGHAPRRITLENLQMPASAVPPPSIADKKTVENAVAVLKEAQPTVKNPVEEKPAEYNAGSSYYRKDESLPLVFEEEPKDISGKAFVFSANELSVGNDYIILYGIYTNPQKYNHDKAHQYMKELVDGKPLKCKIVAYTYHNMATAVCFLNGRSINQNLVDAGYADNVAL